MVLSRIGFATAFALFAAPIAASAGSVAKPPQFAACALCHKAEPNGKPGIGPNLWGVGGTKAGELPNFVFSPAMKSSGIVWNKANLIKFITDPRKAVPGTKMIYVGQKDPAVAAALADYLLSLK